MRENNSLGISRKDKLLSCKKQVKFTRAKVVKMLAVMESAQSSSQLTPDGVQHSQEFLQTGRTGRRNALPDILNEHARVSSADLSAKMQSLCTIEPAASVTLSTAKPPLSSSSGNSPGAAEAGSSKSS